MSDRNNELKKKFYIMQNSWMKKEWSTLWKEIFPSLIVKQKNVYHTFWNKKAFP